MKWGENVAALVAFEFVGECRLIALLLLSPDGFALVGIHSQTLQVKAMLVYFFLERNCLTLKG